jgi:hypothetical protein
LYRAGDKRFPQRQILHRVAGQRHLAEHHDVRTGSGGFPAAIGDHCGVAHDVADTWIHLGQGQTQLRHALIIRLRPRSAAQSRLRDH